MSDKKLFEDWFADNNTDDVEAIVPDMAGAARGKVVPAEKFGDGRMKMPEGVFAQTISGDYVDNPDNVEDKDMWLVADPQTIYDRVQHTLLERVRTKLANAEMGTEPSVALTFAELTRMN